MMFPPPFFRFPNNMFYPQYHYGYSNYSKYINEKNKQLYYNTIKDSSNTCKTEATSKTSEDRNYLEFMGIKLYFDDILLICLIFFLYSEGVQDEMLFISLILLLLS